MNDHYISSLNFVQALPRNAIILKQVVQFIFGQGTRLALRLSCECCRTQDLLSETRPGPHLLNHVLIGELTIATIVNRIVFTESNVLYWLSQSNIRSCNQG